MKIGVEVPVKAQPIEVCFAIRHRKAGWVLDVNIQIKAHGNTSFFCIIPQDVYHKKDFGSCLAFYLISNTFAISLTIIKLLIFKINPESPYRFAGLHVINTDHRAT